MAKPKLSYEYARSAAERDKFFEARSDSPAPILGTVGDYSAVTSGIGKNRRSPMGLAAAVPGIGQALKKRKKDDVFGMVDDKMAGAIPGVGQVAGIAGAMGKGPAQKLEEQGENKKPRYGAGGTDNPVAAFADDLKKKKNGTMSSSDIDAAIKASEDVPGGVGMGIGMSKNLQKAIESAKDLKMYEKEMKKALKGFDIK